LASRALFVSTRPTASSFQLLDDRAEHQIVEEFQPRLLGFRFENLSRVKNCQFSQTELHDLTPRMKQLAFALLAPLHGDPQRQASLAIILRARDEDNRVARMLEPEWLVVEALFRICHEKYPGGGKVVEILAGSVASEIRSMLDDWCEEPKFSARKAGSVLSALGLKTERLGSHGRGFAVNVPFRRKLHHLARDFGLDRRALVSTGAIEAGYCGEQCPLCEEFGLTAGLRSVPVDRRQPRWIISKQRVHDRRPIFDQDDHDVHAQTEESTSS
jgi:hypothetical protein